MEAPDEYRGAFFILAEIYWVEGSSEAFMEQRLADTKSAGSYRTLKPEIH